jgi:hypothetical protein
VLATGPGNIPAVWFASQWRIGSVPALSQIPTRCFFMGQTFTCTLQAPGYAGFGLSCRFETPGLHFSCHNFWLHSDMLLVIAKYWLQFVNFCVGCIGHLNDQNNQRFARCPILKASIKGASMSVGLASWLITAINDFYCLYISFGWFLYAKMFINT